MSRKKQLTALLVSGLALLAAACNTVDGLGQDTESVGETISDAAR